MGQLTQTQTFLCNALAWAAFGHSAAPLLPLLNTLLSTLYHCLSVIGSGLSPSQQWKSPGTVKHGKIVGFGGGPDTRLQFFCTLVRVHSFIIIIDLYTVYIEGCPPKAKVCPSFPAFKKHIFLVGVASWGTAGFHLYVLSVTRRLLMWICAI